MPGTSGVQEQNASVASLLVYPIPANTELNVITTDRDLKWFVRDTQGRLLMQGNWNMDASRTIDIATLTTGNYLLSVIGAKGSATTRFQKL